MRVPDDSISINQAIKNAGPEEIILVRSGTYNETLYIDKPLILRSDGEVTVNGGGADCVLRIIADSVRVEGFSIVNGINGICVEANGCDIIKNKIAGCSTGIRIANSVNMRIKSNVVEGGILIENSRNAAIVENRIKGELYLRRSYDNQILSNTFFDGGLGLWESWRNRVEGNTINGKPLVYLENAKGEIVTDAGQVVAVNCRNLTLKNLKISNVSTGILMWNTTGSLIEGCEVKNCRIGISLINSNENLFVSNLVEGNCYGVYLIDSTGNVVRDTAVRNNTCDVYSDQFKKMGFFESPVFIPLDEIELEDGRKVRLVAEVYGGPVSADIKSIICTEAQNQLIDEISKFSEEVNFDHKDLNSVLERTIRNPQLKKEIETLLDIIADKIRTPLTAILLTLESWGEIDEEVALSLIKKSADRIKRFVDSIGKMVERK
ncbi:NosD domain-containing protein [Archaeoglobus neptunius]|uniref:NosD domain-containing protein n=1 Tax=Archaeoglobus neptunius TaxID=2798580 RepID=UPI0019285A70